MYFTTAIIIVLYSTTLTSLPRHPWLIAFMLTFRFIVSLVLFILMAFKKVLFFNSSLSLFQREKESQGLPGRNKQRTTSTVHRLPFIYSVSGLFYSQEAKFDRELALAFLLHVWPYFTSGISSIFYLLNYPSLRRYCNAVVTIIRFTELNGCLSIV